MMDESKKDAKTDKEIKITECGKWFNMDKAEKMGNSTFGGEFYKTKKGTYIFEAPYHIAGQSPYSIIEYEQLPLYIRAMDDIKPEDEV